MLFEDVETTRPGGPAMTKAGGRLVLVAVALLAASLPSWAQSKDGPAVAMDGAWHFTIAPSAWFSGISGDVSVADLAGLGLELTWNLEGDGLPRPPIAGWSVWVAAHGHRL